ncbi:hypothetical protein [Jonesia quinghaiensis]|uniref:hypothetical protein n=1 Tax=Jonesia quinghaiensis TaxID=262806 RepID=UPI0012F79F18|nr:hypothetical protein [Jonesia quinghaiensis]
MSSSTGMTGFGWRSPSPGAILPRSVSLALWLPRASARTGTTAQALRSVTQDDEPHGVSGLMEGTLVGLIEAWHGRVLACVALCPTPGDVSSVPHEVADVGADAGEVVLVRLGGGVPVNVALIPQVEQFGSHLEPGWHVRWEVREVSAWELQVLGATGSLRDADQELRRAMGEVTEALLTLDIAKSSPQFADIVDILRDPVDLTGFVPADVSPRSLRVLELAARLRAVVDIASHDDGGALTAAAATQRQQALRSLDARARRAMEAATLLSPLVPSPL